MNVREMRKMLGITQRAFAKRYHIPVSTLQSWERGIHAPPEYVTRLLEETVRKDMVNRKTAVIPKYDPKKLDLPKSSNYLGCISWLRAVQECIGEEIVFALDQALMCHQLFLGRSEEYLVWVYGEDTVTRFNGVIVLGNHISEYCTLNKYGLRYTDFCRTLTDSLANESILDMQGITEALSAYYFKNNESFDGIFVPPEYQEKFEVLARDAKEYYDY